MSSRRSIRPSGKQKESRDDKRPTEVKLNLTCPHCDKGLFVLINRDQLQLLRKGFRSKVSQAMRYWGNIRLKIGKVDKK